MFSVMLGILILSKYMQKKLQKKYKELANDRDYDEIELRVEEKDFSKIETKTNICINVFNYENRLTFPF